MHRILCSLIFTISLSACSEHSEPPQSSSQQDKKQAMPQADGGNTLQRQWELTGLSAPESVIYDPARNVLYVSNINGGGTDVDNNGFISRVSLDGKLLELNWISGMNGPKGLAIQGDTLYVSDIDRFHVIDIERGEISQSYTTEDAKFLNDVTVAADGKVFVSDMLTNRIYCLDGDDFGIWLEHADLQSPNGLHAEAERLIVGTWGVMTDGFATDVAGHLKAIDLKDKTIGSLGDGSAVGNLDGLEAMDDGYLVTDWMAGKLMHIDLSGKASLLLTLEQGMADLEYLPEQQLVLLPMMKNDSLLAYSLNR